MRLLLVDDEEDILKIGKLALEAIGGHRVVTATSAADGIALALADPPDAILMDMMMPGMDGLTALTKIKAMPPLAQIPFVFMTAKVQRQESEEYSRAGATGVIQKPFDPMTLAADVAKLVSRAK